MKRRPTIIDVARAAGVSTATVSNALTGHRPVERGTRERVRAVARQLGYVADPRGQRLRTGRPGAIALLSSMPAAVAAGESRLGFMMEIAAATAETALESGLALVLVPPAASGPPRVDYLDVAGAIVIEPLTHDPSVEALLARGIPVVGIGLPSRSASDIPAVDLCSGLVATLMLEHLAGEGARRIALMLGTQPRPSYADTEYVYRRLAARLGMEPVVVRVDERGGEAAAQSACARLLTADPGIDAICAPVDAFAAGCVRALRDSGRSLPREARVVTRYDGLRARTCSPPLTAVDLHLDGIARRAVALLLRELTGETGVALPDVPPPSLVIRESTRVGGGGGI